MSLIRKHKIEKIVLVFICYFCLSIFVVLILGGFYQDLNLEQACNAHFPYLGCQFLSWGIADFLVVMVTIAFPLLTMEWFFKQNIWKLLGMIFTAILCSIFGALILKKMYGQSTTTTSTQTS